ncbi:MAG TPA: hypothetical protein VN706_18885 [Gemmatimonadaceae bacterium]|nr:hypothetical protein [Gemmatimonadaceae bacterium]
MNLQQAESAYTGIPCDNNCGQTIFQGNAFYGSPYQHAKFAADNKRARGNRINAVRGRSASAPPQTEANNLVNNPPHGTAYCPDLTANAWKGPVPKTKIRLAYKGLIPAAPSPAQGMVIDPPHALGGKLLAHFQAVTAAMVACVNDRAETEATGEAAAACAMAFGTTYPGYQMLWGFDTHAGSGIDQIWGHPDGAGGYDEYVIVEAKGVGQTLKKNPHAPPNVGDQMSREWVIDRLSRMLDPLGARVLNDVGLTTHQPVAWQNYGAASKSYYAVNQNNHGPADSKLYGVVFTAKWNAGPKLSWTVSNNVTYYG